MGGIQKTFYNYSAIMYISYRPLKYTWWWRIKSKHYCTCCAPMITNLESRISRCYLQFLKLHFFIETLKVLGFFFRNCNLRMCAKIFSMLSWCLKTFRLQLPLSNPNLYDPNLSLIGTYMKAPSIFLKESL